MAIRDDFIETIVGLPPEGWSLGEVELALKRPDERIVVEAWRRGPFAIHQIDRAGRPARLTHAPTGLQIAPDFTTFDAAAECAEQLEPLCDWNSITERFQLGSDLFPKVKAVVDQWCSEKQPKEG